MIFRVAGIGVLLLSGTWVACSPPTYHGTRIDPPLPVSDFVLEDQEGRSYRFSDHAARLAVVSFGYTYCPDVCPATLSTWARVADGLGDRAEDVRFILISVDPERDRPERLSEHLAIFNADFIGLTGAMKELEEVYETFGVSRSETRFATSELGYLVEHTSRTFVVDRDGISHTFSFGMSSEEMTHDLRLLLKESR